MSNVDPDGRNVVSAFGDLFYETGQWLSGQGFDGSQLSGGLADGYNDEGAGIAASAFQDATSFIPMGTTVKGLNLLSKAGADEGEVAQIIANRAASKAAENLAKTELTQEGNTVLGSPAVKRSSLRMTLYVATSR